MIIIFFFFALAANLCDMAANHEPTVTYEGDNNVLVQQTSNWILRQWNNLQNGTATESPLASVPFLLKGSDILKNKFTPNGKKDLMSLECEYFFFSQQNRKSCHV